MARRDRESKQTAQDVEVLEKLVQLVKNEYEMYFLGIMKQSPVRKEREIKRMIRELTEMNITNTALKFKLRVIKSRYNTLAPHWLRTCKKIEDGTYARHRFMADKREPARAAQHAKNLEVKSQIKALIQGTGDDGDMSDAEATVREATVPSGTATTATTAAEDRAIRASRKAAAKRNAGHEVGSNELLAEYKSVRRKLGAQGEVNGKALEAKLRKTREVIKAKYGVRDVKFRVVAEEGKARLKAIPIK